MKTSQPPKAHRPKIITGSHGSIWHWLIEPSPTIQDVALRRKSRLLSLLLLIMFFLFVLLNIANYVTMPGYTTPPPSLGGYVFMIGSYVLNRIKYYNLAAALTALMVPIVIFLEILTNTSTNPLVTLNYLILGLLLSLILLSMRGTIILASISIIGTLLMPIVAAAAIPDYRIIIGPLSIIIIGAALVMVSMYHRNQIEGDQQVELKKYREQLEDLVVGRTSELSMANEQLQQEIIERKQLEEELRQHHEYLEDLVQARTAELSEANKLLQAEITQRRQAEKKNEATLREKEVLLKEVHHRVKNNLQVVSSLLYLQSKSIDDDIVLEKFTESQNRIRSMALVHESLSRTKNLNRINFADYAQNLVIHVFRSFSGGSGGISPKIDVENLLLSIDTAIPCGLIINELVSNAIKYGFPGGRNEENNKEVQVTFGLQAGEYVLTVSDNGIGLPEDFDIQNTKSLGLKLVDSLVDQLEGTLELQRDGGTTFKVVFTELN